MNPQFTNPSHTHTTSRCLTAARILAASASALLVFFALAPNADAQTTPTLIVVRGMPMHAKLDESFLPQPPLTQADIGQIKIGGKVVPVTHFDQLLGGPHGLQLMVLLDSEQMLGAGGQFDAIKKFFHDMPPNVEIGVGWLLQGKVVVAQPFTTDRDLAGKALIAKTREEAANPKNDNGNPFSCLGYLANHWPTPDPAKLRAILMFNDGAIRSNGQGQAGDSINPDVLSAAAKMEIASITPYPFFWQDPIVADPNRAGGTAVEAADNFGQMDARTGGAYLIEGMFAPGTLEPLLNRLYSTLKSEAVLTVDDPDKPGKMSRLDLKSTRDDIKLFGADQVVSGNVLK